MAFIIVEWHEEGDLMGVNNVRLKEVGPRDGLQNEKNFVSTEDKITFIEKLADTGLDYIEVTSFVHPKWIPQLADATDVFKKIKKVEGITYATLVPNMTGLEQALKTNVDEISVFMSASEKHNKANINKTIEDTFPILNEVVKRALDNNLSVRGYVSTVVGCPYQGEINPELVLYVVDRLFDMGISEISLGDTIGVGVPTDVERLLEVLLKKYPAESFAMHFHDTYGTAIANISKSLEMGIRTFDSSVGGLGGCPYAKGASGNVATEDVYYFLEKMGYKTGLQLGRLIDAANYIEEKLGKSLNSKQLAIYKNEVSH